MSTLRPGDERMHYCDGSHRWIAPRGVDQAAWNAGVQAHVDRHRDRMARIPAGPIAGYAQATPRRNEKTPPAPTGPGGLVQGGRRHVAG